MQIYQSLPKHDLQAAPLHSHAFLSATEVAILLPTMVLLVLVILAARARVPFGRKKNSTQYDNF
jgi:hypothetical protein